MNAKRSVEHVLRDRNVSIVCRGITRGLSNSPLHCETYALPFLAMLPLLVTFCDSLTFIFQIQT